MINRNNKKGFTIVELVIVIAVIAILAAVLIPTFSGIIRKANISADTQLAKNLNDILAADEAVDGKPANFSEVLSILRENGYLVANLNPTAADCYFVWESESNQIILVDTKNENSVIYNSKELTNEAPGATWYFAVSNKADADELKTQIPNINVVMTIAAGSDLNSALGAITGTETIYIDESLVIDKDSAIVLDKSDAKITLDLGTSTVSGDNSDGYSETNIPFYVQAGELTLKGGTLSATGSWLDADNEPVDSAVLATGGVLNLNNTTVDCAGKAIVVAYDGASGTVSNSTITAFSSAINIGGGSNVIVDNCIINVDNEAVWVSNSGVTAPASSSATIKGGEYNGVGNTIALYGGSITIEDGKFTAEQTNLFKFYAANSTITIKRGTFTTANGTYTCDELKAMELEDATAIIKGMFSTGSTNYSGITVTKNADGHFIVKN